MSELKACPICKGTRICMDGGDNTYHPRCLDCGCTAPFDAWQSRTPAPAEVEKLVEELFVNLRYDLGFDKTSVAYSRLINNLSNFKSRLLAALTNTAPNLSGDVIVPVEKLEAGRYRMMIPVEISTTGGLLLDRRDGLHGYSLEDYPNARFFKGW